ncbi:MAG: phosphoglycerate kinase, partial [Fimbriimonadaceae bacterium]|nr:phosphoglycerate kinase [Fimbriimonadaceae bacterium]
MALQKKTVRDADLNGKRVFVRCDFNVPLDGTRITDDRRIVEALPTLRHVLEQGGSLVVASHLGRPKGGPDPKYSLAPVAARLTELLGKPVTLLSDCVGPIVEQACAALKPVENVLQENVRFHSEEEANDPAFAEALAGLADVYVNDAFGTAHRAHASTEGVAHHLPAYAGFLMEKEIEYLGKAVANPQHPFVAVLGGSKVKDKIAVIEQLIGKVDTLILGGGMAFTFLHAQGHPIGKSLLDATNVEFAKDMLAKHGDKILLPTDVVVATELSPEATTVVASVAAIGEDQIGADIGPETTAEFARAIRSAQTVVWNGPMGVFEMTPVAAGPVGLAQALAAGGGTPSEGGGDSAAAI